jgi:hypothetical protein
MNDIFRNGTAEPGRDQIRAMLLERVRVRDGATMEDKIAMLHREGLSIVESMWVIQQAFQLSLSEVKRIVTAHPVWQKTVEANESLHDELEKWVMETAESHR